MHRYSARSFVLGCLAAALPNTAWSQGSLAITGVTVIDGTGRAPIHGATILIREGTIVAVGPSRLSPVPRGAERIKADGRFVIAGLWDAHVHLLAAGRGALPTLVRYGITSVRDLGGGLEAVRRWRNEADAGQFVGPRIHLTGPIVENAGWLKQVRSLNIPGLGAILPERLSVGTTRRPRR